MRSDPNHYLNEAITLTSADVTNFTNGLWYGNVSAPRTRAVKYAVRLVWQATLRRR